MRNNDKKPFEGKRILVLGGSFQHCKVVRAAHELGMKVYVTDYLENSPAKALADVALKYDVKDTEQIVSFCKAEQIDAVINTSLDPCQIPYAKICHELGLPCFGSLEQFRIMTDKRLFKECCKKYGVDIIETFTEEDVKECRADGVFPILIKPVDSRGSRGQTVCYRREDVDAAIKLAKAESNAGEIIIEKYMGGYRDFTVAYLVIDGVAILVRTGDRYVGKREKGMDKVAIASSSPSRYAPIYLNTVHNKIINMIKGIGIKNAPVFFQGFVDGDTVRFYDPGLRFSGGEYESLFLEATGIDLIKLLVEYSVTGRFKKLKMDADISNINGMRIMQLDPILNAGKIGNILGVENVKKHKNVVTFFTRYSVGERVPECNDVRKRFAEIGIVCKSKKEVTDVCRFIQQELKVLDDQGNSLIGDNLDLLQLWV